MSFLQHIQKEQNKFSLEEMTEEVPDKSLVSLVQEHCNYPTWVGVDCSHVDKETSLFNHICYIM